MRIDVTAPGKLVLSGEYAVLHGAPAVCMAVDRRARVTIEDSDEDHHTVSAPGFSEATGRFRAANGSFEWLNGGDDYDLFRNVWQMAGVQPTRPRAITLDTHEFFHRRSGVKIGVGSSAALASALAKALTPPGEDALRVAFDAHRQFQSGVGSGADVACSIAGGLIEYTMNGTLIDSLQWPTGLHFAVVWVGEPASTRERLIRLGKQSKRVSGAALVMASRRMARAWRSAVARDILLEYADYIGVLREFSVDHDLGIFDAGHDKLTDAAVEMGVVYKPCGAGSGDVGIVLADEAAAVEEFVGLAEARNARPVNINLDTDGVQMDRESS